MENIVINYFMVLWRVVCGEVTGKMERQFRTKKQSSKSHRSEVN